MSLFHTTTCDFCGRAETAPSAELPHGWAALGVSYSRALHASLHVCPGCQTPVRARAFWAQVDRVMALQAGVPNTLPVPVVLLDPDENDPAGPSTPRAH